MLHEPAATVYEPPALLDADERALVAIDDLRSELRHFLIEPRR